MPEHSIHHPFDDGWSGYIATLLCEDDRQTGLVASIVELCQWLRDFADLAENVHCEWGRMCLDDDNLSYRFEQMCVWMRELGELYGRHGAARRAAES